MPMTTPRTFKGFACLFGLPNSNGDLFQHGCFKGLRDGTPILLDHQAGTCVGVCRPHLTARGLLVFGRLYEDDGPAGLLTDRPGPRDVFTLMKAGVLRGLSIGCRITKSETRSTYRRITEAFLTEVSLTRDPACDSAQVLHVG
jgi:HK97 family phage prohead protease